MAKLSKEEFKAKIDTLPIDEEVKIELLEDIEDSMEIVEEQPNEYETKYNELLEKYKSRFFEKVEEVVEEEKEEIDDEQKEEEIIDVKEI